MRAFSSLCFCFHPPSCEDSGSSGSFYFLEGGGSHEKQLEAKSSTARRELYKSDRCTTHDAALLTNRKQAHITSAPALFRWAEPNHKNDPVVTGSSVFRKC